MRSYEDRGSLRTSDDVVTFTTRYSAPSFRLEFVHHSPNSLLPDFTTQWRIEHDGKMAQLFVNGVLDMTGSASEVVHAATGISLGMVHTIAGLLLAEVEWPFVRADELHYVGEELEAGAWCYRIQGQRDGGRLWEFLIDPNDLVIRRLRRGYENWTTTEVREDIRFTTDSPR